MSQALIYVASVTVAVWGVAHLFATSGVVAGFGGLTDENRLLITIEWIVERVALIATAACVAVVTVVLPEAVVASAVYTVAVATLVAFAIVSLFTGFKITFLPFRLCPFVLGAAAALIAGGASLRGGPPAACEPWRPSGIGRFPSCGSRAFMHAH